MLQQGQIAVFLLAKAQSSRVPTCRMTQGGDQIRIVQMGNNKEYVQVVRQATTKSAGCIRQTAVLRAGDSRRNTAKLCKPRFCLCNFFSQEFARALQNATPMCAHAVARCEVHKVKHLW